MSFSDRYKLLICIALSLAAESIARAEFRLGLPGAGELPAYLLELPESVSEVLIADTGSATLYRFVVTDQAVLGVDQRYMSIGLNGVGKQRAWDRKTPLGVYFITERLDTSRMNSKYGVAAFPLDYPNAWDRQNDRTGDGIWLHGVDRADPERPPLDTDGCLALANQELLQLADTIQPLKTPLIVARQIDWASPAELASLRRELRAVLDRWRHSLEQGDQQSFRSLYHGNFNFRGVEDPDGLASRLDDFAAGELYSVKLRDVLLLADPEEPGLYLSRFTEVATGSGGTVTTTRRLYWKRAANKFLRIVSEDSG